MKFPTFRATALLVVLALTLPAVSESAKSLFNQGKDAEARQNYEQAYDFYKRAYDLKPKDLAYRAAYERLRFLAGASHVHRGQLLRSAGKLEEALAEFNKALEIDPASSIAQQEARQTQRMIDAAKTGSPRSQGSPPGSSLMRRLENAPGPVELTAISPTPITLKMANQDTKTIYETVGKLAGINVLFDPDYTSRRISIDLNSVTLQEALQIIALQSKTFWRPVTSNTVYIAQENPTKRKEVEQNVIKTFYLSNLSQQTEIQEIVNTLRMILEISKIQALPSQNAVVVRGTPDQIALAEKLVSDLDKAKPEVVVDIAIMQVSRDKMHNLGISPPTSATVALQPNINTTTTTTTTGTTTPTSNGTNNDNTINLNALGNLNAKDFQVTITPMTATALFSDSSTKLLQQPQLRALEGQKASLKIGDRIPTATGSFQPGIGGVGINPLVNTQFQYQDVGVNIDITPYIHAEGDVTLKITMDVSSVTGQSNIGGISQPIIGQRKIDHEIRLRDGEVNLVGGMMEDQNTKSISGIPGLAQIPILKFLFSSTNTEHRENEIVFALIPHIVRRLDVDDLNQNALAVGTANVISLSAMGKPAPAGTGSGIPGQVPATQPEGMQTPPPVQAPQQAPVGAPPQAAAPTGQPGAPPAAGVAAFTFDRPSITQASGSTFTVSIQLTGAQNVYSVPLQVTYDPKAVQVMNVSNGGLLSQDGQAVALVHRDDGNGTLQITATRPPGSGGVSGQGAVVTLTLQAKAAGQSMLVISQGGARDPGMQPIPVAGATVPVTIQ